MAIIHCLFGKCVLGYSETLYSVFWVTVLCSKLECASYVIKSTALLQCSLLRHTAAVAYVHSSGGLLCNKIQAECRYHYT